MTSLVADYSSDSSSDCEGGLNARSPEGTQSADETKVTISEKLPSPNFLKASNEVQHSCGNIQSVFSNPFRDAEAAQTSLLEKHVKMTPTNKQTNLLNGKQICWNYRKGKCRFGHNCKFMHDSDMPSSNLIENENTSSHLELNRENFNDSEPPCKIKKKKRPGLTEGLTPSKKVMKTYFQQNKNVPKV